MSSKKPKPGTDVAVTEPEILTGTEIDKIADPLKPLAVPLAMLELDPNNARTHDAAGIASIAASLARFGQTKPIVIDAHNIVRAGNGTVMAARELGWTTIAASRFVGDEVHARGFAVADNRTAELSTWDEQALELALGVLNASDPTLTEAAGFTEREIAELSVRVADQQAARAALEAMGGSKGAPIPLPTYTIVFDKAKEKGMWDAFMGALKPAYPSLEHNGSRLLAFLRDQKTKEP